MSCKGKADALRRPFWFVGAGLQLCKIKGSPHPPLRGTFSRKREKGTLVIATSRTGHRACPSGFAFASAFASAFAFAFAFGFELWL